jgi:catalase
LSSSTGFVSFPQPVEEDKVRGKPEKFAEHYAQATLFYESQTPVDQAHIAAAFRFELSKVQVPAIRERMVSSLRNVSEPLAAKIAEGLGIPLPDAMPKAFQGRLKPEIAVSPALSRAARPGETGIATLQVALIVGPGVDIRPLVAVHEALKSEGACPKWVGPRIGPIKGGDGVTVECEASLENATSVLFDGLVIPDLESAGAFAANAQLGEWARDAYRHCKTLLLFGDAAGWKSALAIPATLADGQSDPGIVVGDEDTAEDAVSQFVNELRQFKHYERDRDPPLA